MIRRGGNHDEKRVDLDNDSHRSFAWDNLILGYV